MRNLLWPIYNEPAAKNIGLEERRLLLTRLASSVQ